MTGSVQMTGSTSSALAEPRGSRRSSGSSKNPSQDVTGTDDASSDGSSHVNSSEDGDSGDRSSFGAVLRQHLVRQDNARSNHGGRASQNSQADTGQQKKNSAEADALTTVPDQTNE